MNKVLSGYFDDSHRGLLRASSVPAIVKDAQGNAALPPLRPGSGSASRGSRRPVGGLSDMSTSSDKQRDLSGWDKVMGSSLQDSKFSGMFDFSREQASRGVQQEEYQQALQDSSKLARRVRSMQEQLSVASAKKDAFRSQAQRLEKEFRKGRDQSELLQKELMDAKREAAEATKEAQEAISMMTEMRKAHIQEVKLLQRGLAQRASNDPNSRNRVNEMADLIDKVGRAVVQRDEAIRDKTSMHAHLNKAVKDLRAMSDECARLKRQNKQLAEGLREAKRKGQYAPPRASRSLEGDSDEEFEHELEQFERRFVILEEGPAGLDVLASNLSKDKQDLERRCRGYQQTVRSLGETIENWKALGEEKDQQISELSGRLERTLRERAILEEQITQKQREIALEVEHERAAMQARISELELECDNARASADGMDKASRRLARELARANGSPPSAGAAALAAAGDSAATGASAAAGGGAATAPSAQDSKDTGGSGEVAGGLGDAAPTTSEAPRRPTAELVMSARSVRAKTGEVLDMEVRKDADGRVEILAREPGGGEEWRPLPVDPELLAELDEADPWADLLGRVGVDPGPPRQLVVAERVGQRELQLGASESPVLLTIYRYSPRRFFVAGVELSTQRVLSLALGEGSLPPALEVELEACTAPAMVFDVVASALSLDDGDGGLVIR